MGGWCARLRFSGKLTAPSVWDGCWPRLAGRCCGGFSTDSTGFLRDSECHWGGFSGDRALRGLALFRTKNLLTHEHSHHLPLRGWTHFQERLEQARLQVFGLCAGWDTVLSWPSRRRWVCVRLTFASSIADWRSACDLLGWRCLGQALNEKWALNLSVAEWRILVEPAGQRTLRTTSAMRRRAAGLQEPTRMNIFQLTERTPTIKNAATGSSPRRGRAFPHLSQ